MELTAFIDEGTRGGDYTSISIFKEDCHLVNNIILTTDEYEAMKLAFEVEFKVRYCDV